MKTVILMMIFGTLKALHCDKEYNQMESFYERGFDITCQGLNNDFIHLLEKLEVTNEISLKMENCTLTSVSSKLFENIRRIKHLYLENSTFSYAISEPVFQNLTKLEDLEIINTKFKVTAISFSKLTTLKKLQLRNNDLKKIERGSFNNLINLSKLEITENHLKDLKNVPLCELKNLKNLNFSKNEIEDLGRAFYCENIPDTSSININDRNQIIGSRSESMKLVTSLKLTEIDLSYNYIEDLSSSFAYLKSLKIIKLQGNKLSRLNNSQFNFLEYLENLRVDNNSITFVENNVFKGKEYLETIDLSNNYLVFLNLADVRTVKYLNLAGNNLNVDTLLTINVNNTFKTLLLDNNNISKIKPNIFEKLVKLNALHLSNNKIELTDTSLCGLVNLKKLCLSNNSIKILPKEVFKDLQNLTLLDLSQNNLTTIEYSEIFTSLKHLEELNLSRNSLTNLSFALVKPLKNLVVLDLSYNKLHSIDYDVIMSNLPLLNILDIKFNVLSCEFLSKIISYLQSNGVSYTLQEKIDLDKVNVGGIYCSNEKSTNDMQVEAGQTVPQNNVMFDATLGLIIILAIVILSVILFKIHIYLKRRNYRADEFELIDE